MFRFAEQDGVARLTLDRLEARNAIPAGRWAELAQLVEGARNSRLLLVTGSNGAFCAGADLADFTRLRGDEPARARFRTDMRSAFDALRDLPIPTVALVDGPCFGAGVALAMACDLRMAAPAARFAITPAKIGVSYPQEDVHRLVSLVGPGQAARLLFTAATIDAAEALRIGLVELEGTDEGALCSAILANDEASLAELKRAIRLAAQGVASDSGQDQRFDALIAGDVLVRRLEALRRK